VRGEGAHESAQVLVVDDDVAVRRLHATALKRAGFGVLEAEDGSAALEVLRSNRVDLLLIDHHMPGMTGMEVIEEVRQHERTRTLPIILATGTGDIPNRIRGLDVGANDYVVKTTHLDELVARVRAQLRASVAWADQLGHELEARARVVTTLGAIPAAETPEATAGALVAKLAELEGIGIVAILHVDAARRLAPLADWSADKGLRVGGLPITRVASRYLVSHAASGPWSDSVAEAPALRSARFVPDEVDMIHATPMRLGDRMVGIFVLGTMRTGEADAPAGDVLAATIDYAAVATAVLGPALAERGRETNERHLLERVISEQAFHPVFQPIVGLSEGEVVGYEALTRFADGTPPDRRFAEAGRLGLGRQFEEATLAAIMHAAEQLPAGMWLSLNISPELVLQSGWLADQIQGTRRRLVVELTEHAPIDDYESLRQTLRALPSSIAIAVDDAGAGYASLRHIYELRPTFVKLDMGLVRGVERDPLRQALIAGLVHFADDTGSRLIAEGIETEAEASVMRRLHVSIGQGYLFGRPVDVSELIGVRQAQRSA
jgi:EAL domain-containing protein (putative c-di-GMP-specific phosphodiesterase class I)/CheY-like chemotaxis protein